MTHPPPLPSTCAVVALFLLVGCPGNTSGPNGTGSSSGTKDTAEAFARAVALHESGDLEESTAAFGRVLDQDPDHVGALLNRGVVRFELMDLKGSMEDLDRAIELSGDDVGVLLARGQVRAAAGLTDWALDDYTAAVKLDPLTSEAYELRADLWAELGEVEAAIADYNNAVRLSPDDPLLYRARGQLLEEAGRDDEAAIDATLTQLVTDLDRRPDDCTLRLQRGLAFLDLDEPELSLSDLDRVIAARPKDAAALLARGHAHLLVGEEEKALADYSAAVAAAPGDVPSHLARALVYESIGAYAEAVTDLEAALESAADDPDVLLRLSWLLSTARDPKVRDGARALELARRLPRSEAEPWLQPDTLAAALAETGQFEEASVQAKAALALAPDDLRPPFQARWNAYREGRAHRE